MKTLSAVLLLAMLCSHQLVSDAIAPVSSEDCCTNYYKKIIPFRQLVSYSRTSSSCPKQAVVFKTMKGMQFCVDEKQSWVRNHIAKSEMAVTMTTEQTAA